MFKTTKDFDESVYQVLVKIRDGENWQELPPNLEKLDYSDVL